MAAVPQESGRARWGLYLDTPETGRAIWTLACPAITMAAAFQEGQRVRWDLYLDRDPSHVYGVVEGSEVLNDGGPPKRVYTLRLDESDACRSATVQVPESMLRAAN